MTGRRLGIEEDSQEIRFGLNLFCGHGLQELLRAEDANPQGIADVLKGAVALQPASSRKA